MDLPEPMHPLQPRRNCSPHDFQPISRRFGEREQSGRARGGGIALHVGQRGCQPAAHGRSDCRRHPDPVAGSRCRRHSFTVGSRRGLRRPARQPPQPEGGRCRSSLRPSALRNSRVPGARRPAARRRHRHAVVGGAQARGPGRGADGSRDCAVGGRRSPDRQGGAVPVHAGRGQARQVKHAGGQCVARAFRCGVVAGGRRGHRRESRRISAARPDRRLDCRFHGRENRLGIRLGCAA